MQRVEKYQGVVEGGTIRRPFFIDVSCETLIKKRLGILGFNIL